MKQPLLDVHTHTLASGHGYSTIKEMAEEASKRGLKILGITEHGPSIPGTCRPLYFRNMFVVPREMFGVKLLLGCEVNILNTQGELDLDETHLDFLDICIAGIHSVCWQGGTKTQNTDGMIAAINNPKVHIISHPGDGTTELDFEAIVLASKEANTLLEINNHSLAPRRNKTQAMPNNLELLRLAKKHDVPVILGSDAHVYSQIADYERLYPLLAETQFPDELIVNYSPKFFSEYLNILG